MEQIAPLAKILAEANGIDWTGLRGSGSGGMIVEQDVLTHLARIMSGEEEPPATPVDAPPPDWTGEEIPAGLGLGAPGLPTADMLSSAGVDSDITALVAQVQSAPAASAPAAHHEDDFELDDDAAELAPPIPAPVAASLGAPVPQPVPAVPVYAAAPAPTPFPEVRPAAHAAPVVPEPVPAVAEPVVAAPAAASTGGGLGAGLGSLLSRLYQPAAPAAPAPTPAPEPVPAPAAFIPAPPVAEVPAAHVPEVVAPEVQAPEVPTISAEFSPEVAEEPAVPAEPVAAQPEPEVVHSEQVELAAPVAEEPAAPSVPEVAEEPVAEAEPVQPIPAAEPMPAMAPAAARPETAVWFGTYLRRDVDLAAAADLRGQLGAALGQDVPLAFLVARAARRHAAGLGLGTVALHDAVTGRAWTVQPGALRDALAALDTEHEGTPDLLITDAGTLDLDDLHLPHTLTLSVGRLSGGRAALSLNGDVEPARGAAFLAEVAGALAQPIILVI